MKTAVEPRHDGVAALLGAGDAVLTWNVRRDVLGERPDPRQLWTLPAVTRMAARQRADGAWAYPASRARRVRREDYDQVETYKRLLTLVSLFRLDRRHPAVARAAGFLLSHQTAEGDIRGIYGAQLTPNYTADILRLLLEAGYQGDERVDRGMDYLLRSRQDDGGWAIPARTVRGMTLAAALAADEPVAGDPTRPSSHLVTGIVLRAFAAHPRFRRRREATAAARLLASRFFQADRYPDHRSAAYWTKLAFPFRWTDLVSALDSIALIGLGRSDRDVEHGLRWLVDNQARDGLWRSGYPKTRDPLVNHWCSFAVLRVFARLAR